MDEFREAQANLRPPGVAGWWVKVLDEVDADRAEALLAAAADPEISNRAIALVVSGWGFPVTREKVAHWRRNHVG